MWWGDLQQQMELNQNEIEAKARKAWMWADDGGHKGNWFRKWWGFLWLMTCILWLC